VNSLEYFSYEMLACMAYWYVAEHFNAGDGYCVVDVDGLPLFGFIPNNQKEKHILQIKPNLR
jgi:hypothetical protein